MPKIVTGGDTESFKGKIRNFEKSDSNFIRTVNAFYKGGIASKQKYISIKSSLSMCMNENRVGRKHIEFVKKIPVPRLFTYQKLMARVNQINIGDLYDVKEVLCQGLSEEYQVNGKFRNLQQLLLKMA